MGKDEIILEYSYWEFYNPVNNRRYIEYALSNPHLDPSEVVWRVNCHLDRDKYSVDIVTENPSDLLAIVNKYFRLPSSYVPEDMVTRSGCAMRRETAEAYDSMKSAAEREGYTICVTSAYRSAKTQEQTYNRYLEKDPVSVVDETVARPCHSEHQTGLALDIEGSVPGGRNILKTPEAKWLSDNCHRFGFILRYQPDIVDITGYAWEPWHFRYVGTDVSTDMVKRNIKSFEEYWAKFLNHPKTEEAK